jgi:hypothetical protein
MRLTLPLPHGPTALDIPMFHPRCPTYVAATSQTRGGAAAPRDRSKYRAHAGHMQPGHAFVPARGRCGTFLFCKILRARALLLLPGDRCLLVPTGNRVWLLCRVCVKCTALAQC